MRYLLIVLFGAFLMGQEATAHQECDIIQEDSPSDRDGGCVASDCSPVSTPVSTAAQVCPVKCCRKRCCPCPRLKNAVLAVKSRIHKRPLVRSIRYRIYKRPILRSLWRCR